jgi:hypothetical protein
MNRLATLVFAISATVVSTATFAQAAPAAVVPAAQAQPAGKTRAEVIAEMKAARLRGELQAGHDWGIDVPPVQRTNRQVQLTKRAE